MKAKRKLPLTPWSLGSIPVTSVEIDQPVAADPAAERAARLKSRAAEILAENAQKEQAAQQAAQARQDATRQRIEAVRTSCVNATEWAAVLELVKDPESYSRQQVLDGSAYEDALRSLRYIQDGIR
jgi:hypothetical protein